MSKFWTFFGQMYQEKIKSKSFILLTCLYIAVASVVLFWSDIKALVSDRFAEEVAIVNLTSVDLTQTFQNNGSFNYKYLTEENNLKKALEDETYKAAITLKEQNEQLYATILSKEALPLNDQMLLEEGIQTASTPFLLEKLQLSPAQQTLFLEFKPNIVIENLTSDGKTLEEKSIGRLVAYLSGFLIFIFVSNYLSMIVTNIASEKGSRNLEMIFVNVRPETHFKAKLASVFSLAMTQFILLFGVLFVLLTFVKEGKYLDELQKLMAEISVSYFVYAVLFLLLSLCLFLILGGLFGSLVSKADETNQVSSPVIMVVMISFYVMLSGLANPDTLLIKICSYIPLSSGMVMPMRIGATDVSTFEVILSLGILFATTIFLYFFAVSFYKRSVLTYASGGVIEKIKSVFKYTT